MGRFARRGQVRFPLVREFSGTAGEFSETFGELSETVGEFSKTFGEFSETFGELSETSGEFSETSGELSDTLGEFSMVCPHRYDGRMTIHGETCRRIEISRYPAARLPEAPVCRPAHAAVEDRGRAPVLRWTAQAAQPARTAGL
jgi:hypothetical protein